MSVKKERVQRHRIVDGHCAESVPAVRTLKDNLSSEDKAALDLFIDAKRAERIYILRLGALEAYLPLGHGSKDLNKLIVLLAD
jgi:hypothetical protein